MNASRRKSEGAHPPRRRRNRVRFTPTAEISIATSVSATRRSRGNPSMPETPSSRPPQNSPKSVPPDFSAFVGIWRNSCTPSARWTSMGDEPTCTSENCKTLRMTRSSMYTSPIVFCAREGESSDQQGSFIQCARSEQLSAMSTFERVNGADFFYDNCGHPDLAGVLFRNGFDGSTLLRRCCKPNFQVHQYQTHPNFSSSKCSSQLRGMRGPITCLATRDHASESWARQVRVYCFFPRLFNGHLSLNLSRLSSFAIENAPEANLGSREEEGNMQANLQRSILRTQARHCCRVTAKNEESSPSASGSSGLQKSCGSGGWWRGLP